MVDATFDRIPDENIEKILVTGGFKNKEKWEIAVDCIDTNYTYKQATIIVTDESISFRNYDYQHSWKSNEIEWVAALCHCYYRLERIQNSYLH